MERIQQAAILYETGSANGQAPASDIADLTRRMASGDEMAYRMFFELYFNRLLSYLLVLAQGREEPAREALQQVFLRVARHIRGFDSEAVFWSWLTVLARSAIVDEHRRTARYLAVLDRFFRRQRVEAELAGDTEDRLLKLLEVNLEGLPPEERRLIELKYLEQQSVEGIAVASQTSEKAIEGRLARIRRKLKEGILADLNHEREL